ncbi:hypothetical protein AX16_000812 [Volvariella volvacea WC 439]|nr:hypothetical protein AX16_000812 [Volvariella volvacea WC 439]
MADGDPDTSHAAYGSDPRILFATTIVTLVFAGSAFLWRSGAPFPRHLLALRRSADGNGLEPDCKSFMKSDSQDGQGVSLMSGKSSPSGTHMRIATPTGHNNNDNEVKDVKNQRPKERRRRGKDPAKELPKAGKKLKAMGKAIPSAEGEGSQPSTPGRVPDETQLPSTSPPPFLSSMSGSRRGPSSTCPAATISSSQGFTTNDTEATTESSTPKASPPPVSNPENVEPSTGGSFTQDARAAATSTDPRENDVSSHAQDLESSTISVLSTSPHGSTTSTSSSASESTSEPAITPSTSPSLSLPDNIPSTPTHMQVSESHTIYSTSHIGPSTANASHNYHMKHPTPWDWEEAQLPAPEIAYRKPPRFHSQPRGGLSPLPLHSPVSMMPLVSGSSPPYPFPNPDSSSSSTLLPSSSMDSDPPLITFPTLNGPSSTSINGSLSSGPGSAGNSMNSTINGNNGTCCSPSSRHIPRRTPTPSSGTNTPSLPLSAQTQIASLRGALEAARLREEKLKSEIERLGKELEMIRWECMSSRRRETELQTQLQQTTLQLQTYVGLYSSLPPQSSTSPFANGNSNGENSTSSSASTQQNGSSSSSIPHSPMPSHLALHSPPQSLSPSVILSPVGLASPVALPGLAHPTSSSVPPSPYFGYPPHNPSANFYSMFYPMGLSMNYHIHAPGNSRPGSVAGSSVGSLSPDLAGPSSPRLSMMLDRGRRKLRGKKTNGFNNKHLGIWEESNDGWVVHHDGATADAPAADVHDEDLEEESEFSEILADAILKRPESIMVGSVKKKSGVKEKDDCMVEGVPPKASTPPISSGAIQPEFIFPSLSDLGNVHSTQRYHHQTKEDKERETAIAELAASVAATMQAATIVEGTSTPPAATSEGSRWDWSGSDKTDCDSRDDMVLDKTLQDSDALHTPPSSNDANDTVFEKTAPDAQITHTQPPVSN